MIHSKAFLILHLKYNGKKVKKQWSVSTEQSPDLEWRPQMSTFQKPTGQVTFFI